MDQRQQQMLVYICICLPLLNSDLFVHLCLFSETRLFNQKARERERERVDERWWSGLATRNSESVTDRGGERERVRTFPAFSNQRFIGLKLHTTNSLCNTESVTVWIKYSFPKRNENESDSLSLSAFIPKDNKSDTRKERERGREREWKSKVQFCRLLCHFVFWHVYICKSFKN